MSRNQGKRQYFIFDKLRMFVISMHYKCFFLTLKCLHLRYNFSVTVPRVAYINGILPKGPYPPCLRMADRALLAGYPRYILYMCENILLKVQNTVWCHYNVVIFLWNSHERHTIAGPLGLDMACALVDSISDLYSAPITALMYAISCCTGLRYKFRLYLVF